MRLLRNKIWRAFPELDPYTDEQCQRFFKAAVGTPVVRSVRIVLVVLLSVATLIGSATLCMYILSEVYGSNTNAMDRQDIAVYSTLIFAVVLGPFAGIIARDLLLRLRVRKVLRSRGRCSNCTYSLLGLAVNAKHEVACPECGTLTEVDPSLGELVTNDQGHVQFNPDASTVSAREFWTPARKKFTKRAAIAFLVLFVLLPGVGMGLYEIFLRYQASVARANRVTNADLLKAIRAADPIQADTTQPDAWDSILIALARIEDINASPSTEVARLSDGRPATPEFAYVGIHQSLWDKGSWPVADQVLMRDQALRLLKAYDHAEIWTLLDEAALRPKSTGILEANPEKTVNYSSTTRTTAWYLVRIVPARLRLAATDRDLPTFLQAYEHHLLLKRLFGSYSVILQAALDSPALEILIESLPTLAPDETTLDAILAAHNRQGLLIPSAVEPTPALLDPWMQDYIAEFFSTPAKARFGIYGKGAEDLGWSLSAMTKPTRLGTYWSNMEAMQTLITELTRASETRAFERDLTPLDAAIDHASRFVLTNPSAMFAKPSNLATADKAHLARDTLLVQIALERHRLAHGSYPETLAELVPAFLTEAPIDPNTGVTFGYHRSTNTKHPYVLYSIGPNKIDDHAATPFDDAAIRSFIDHKDAVDDWPLYPMPNSP
ncbi:MAG: hypothetical protein IPK69_13365 [Phycisphaerales bacterium]|nr:MAG: hypothetical protein IPK69_13365 [Phycisphaerales bacterium]